MVTTLTGAARQAGWVACLAAGPQPCWTPGIRPGARSSTRWLLAASAAGFVAGHAITYSLAVPDHHQHEAVLQETGHSYWPAALTVGLLGFAWAAAAVVNRRLRGRRSSPPARGWSWITPRVVVLQVALFVAVEIIERLAAGEPVSSLFDHHLLSLGLIVQVVVAVAVATVLYLLDRAAAGLARLLAGPAPVYGARPAWSPSRVVAVASLHFRPRTSRGPPWRLVAVI
jgi:hypothetical protein